MNATPAETRPLRIWLWLVAAAILLMVLVGGVTRLTDSGLSMVEWKLITGAIPPLNEADWQDVFAKYKATPQYQQINRDMDLSGFKRIFFWEYLHRLLGRGIGLLFALPLAWFWWRRRIPPGYHGPLLGVFLLGAAQGGMGAWMVASGLVEQPRVSHFRLAAHLLLAFLSFNCVLWIIWRLRADAGKSPPPQPTPALARRCAWGLTLLLWLQIVYGAFVAGLRAGYLYNTFPKMLGYWLPPDARRGPPLDWLANNPVSVQFIHRSLAWLLLFGVLAFWLLSKRLNLSPTTRAPLRAIAAVTALQFTLGIVTLLTHVHLHVAVTHQVLACLLSGCFTWLLFRLRSPQSSSNSTPNRNSGPLETGNA